MSIFKKFFNLCYSGKRRCKRCNLRIPKGAGTCVGENCIRFRLAFLESVK